MISFINKNTNFDKKKEAALIVASLFFLNKLIRGNVSIFFEWKNLDFPQYAYVERDLVQKQSYKITLSNYLSTDTDLLLRSVAHELVHVKQMATGQLYQPFKDNALISAWKVKNQKVQFVKNIQAESYSNYADYQKDYLNLPWEKEAFEKMNPLYLNMYRHFYKDSITNALFVFFKPFLFKKEYIYLKNVKKNYGIGFFDLIFIRKFLCK